jgi:hypothetical protein
MRDKLGSRLSVTTRRELIEAVAARYRADGRNEKKEILDEFVKVTGFHRKHAIRALRTALKQQFLKIAKVEIQLNPIRLSSMCHSDDKSPVRRSDQLHAKRGHRGRNSHSGNWTGAVHSRLVVE